jgi:hypothetical protein
MDADAVIQAVERLLEWLAAETRRESEAPAQPAHAEAAPAGSSAASGARGARPPRRAATGMMR